MKTKKLILSLVIAMTALCSCHSEIENNLELLERRIASLENMCKQLNSNITSFQKIITSLQKDDFVSRVVTNYNPDYSIASYTIYFMNSKPITIYNGSDSNTPIIGVSKDVDGVYYWTVRYTAYQEPQFVLDNYGQKVAASASSPQLRIEDGMWYMTLGNYDKCLGKATGDDGTSFFSSVVDYNDYIQFNFLDSTNTPLKIPTWDSYESLKEACNQANENANALTTLVSTLNEKVYAKDIVPILSTARDTMGFTLTLSNGESFSFYNGTSTNVPELMAARDTAAAGDMAYYWTIRYSGQENFEWITDETGAKVRADATNANPIELTLTRDSEYTNLFYWALVINGKETPLLCNGNKVIASASGSSLFKRIDIKDDKIIFTLTNNEIVYIPRFPDILVEFSENIIVDTLKVRALDTVKFTATLVDGDKRCSILPVAQDGFYATASPVDSATWSVTVISPLEFGPTDSSKLNLLVSNGRGIIKTMVIHIIFKEEEGKGSGEGSGEGEGAGGDDKKEEKEGKEETE